MKRLLTLIAAAALVMASFGSALATNGMYVIGVGPISRSMAGATTGLALDASTVMTNPAGMADLGGRIDFGVTYFAPTSKYSATDFSSGSANAIPEMSSDTPASPMPAFGLIIPINEQFKFGIGAYGTAGMGVDYASALYGNVTYTNFSMMKFAPGVSYEFNKYVSIGAALNVDYATMAFNAGRSLTSGAIISHDSNSQMGIGFQVGVQVKPLDWLQIGLAYTSRQYFSDFEFNTPAGKDKLDFDLPQTIALGFGFKLHPRFRVGLDIKWINWDSTMGANKPEWSSVPSGSGAWNVSWDNQWVFAIGAEFDATEWLKLRAGYNYAANPLSGNRAFENIAFPALIESHFTAGMGFEINKSVEINISGMYAPEVSISGANMSQQGIAAYTTSLQEWSISAGVTYKF